MDALRRIPIPANEFDDVGATADEEDPLRGDKAQPAAGDDCAHQRVSHEQKGGKPAA